MTGNRVLSVIKYRVEPAGFTKVNLIHNGGDRIIFTALDVNNKEVELVAYKNDTTSFKDTELWVSYDGEKWTMVGPEEVAYERV